MAYLNCDQSVMSAMRMGLILSAAMTLSGCANMGPFGSSLWDGTQSLASNTVDLFRPAPRTQAAYSGQYTAQERTTAQPDYRLRGPIAAPVQTVEATVETKTFSEGDQLSYVKMGGGSSMADWQACEREAGGYFTPREGRYGVNPNFDRCMRIKDYLPESEAQSRMALAQMAGASAYSPAP